LDSAIVGYCPNKTVLLYIDKIPQNKNRTMPMYDSNTAGICHNNTVKEDNATIPQHYRRTLPQYHKSLVNNATVP